MLATARCLLLLAILSVAAAKSPVDYLKDAAAAAKECMTKGCFLSGIHPATGDIFFPTTTVFSKDVTTSGETPGCYRIPAILQHPTTTTIHAFAEARFGDKDHFECADCSVLGIAHRRSFDGGDTWEEEAKWVVDHSPTDPTDPTSNVGGNIVVVYDEKDDKIVLHFVRGVSANGDCVPGNSNWEVVSYDDGETWSEPREISSFLGSFVGVLPGPGTGIQLQNGPHKGRLVMPGHYETAFRGDGADIVYYSDDSGGTWTVTETPLPLMDEDTVVEIGTEGHIVLNMRNADLDKRARAVAYSEDGGQTFGPIAFDETLIDPICEGSLAPASAGQIMFANPAMQYSRSMLTVRFSEDGGGTWDDEKNVVIADKFADYSSLVAGSVLGGESGGSGEGGVLWGSCDHPMPWRVWCGNAHEWTVLFSKFALPAAAAAGVEAPEEEQMLWADGTELTLLGSGFPQDVLPLPYNRLPGSAEGQIRQVVYNLGEDSAGIALEFETDSPSIAVRYNLTSPLQCEAMWHMPASGVSGVDLYALNDFGEETKDANTWQFVGHFGPPAFPVMESTIDGLPDDGVKRKFRMHLPLYNSLLKVQVGVQVGKSLTGSETLDLKERVLWYGSSIAQGAVASRPGTTFTNVIRNAIGTDVVNLGFSGNCLMELDVAQFLVQVTGVRVVVVDCLPNMDADMVASRTAPLVNFLREKLGEAVTIVLAEGTTYGGAWLIEGVSQLQEAKREALKTEFDKLKAAGMERLVYVQGVDLGAGDSFSSPTVEGTHLTDVGHQNVADYYAKLLPGLLVD